MDVAAEANDIAKPRSARYANSLWSPKPRSARMVTCNRRTTSTSAADRYPRWRCADPSTRLSTPTATTAASPGHAGDQVERQRCLVVAVEIRPVHATTMSVRDPARCGTSGRSSPRHRCRLAEQPVDLLDRMLGHQAACCARPGRSSQRRATRGHHAQRGCGERVHALGVEVVPYRSSMNARMSFNRPQSRSSALPSA